MTNKVLFSKVENLKPEVKQLYILRGISGSGKSTLTKALTKKLEAENIKYKICSADFFFMRDGKYCFNVSKLGQAHQHSQASAKECMKNNMPVVIIDNTNLKYWEMKPYVEEAKRFSYDIKVLEIKTPLNSILERQKKCKNLPDEKVFDMYKKLNSSKLPDDINKNTIYFDGTAEL